MLADAWQWLIDAFRLAGPQRRGIESVARSRHGLDRRRRRTARRSRPARRHRSFPFERLEAREYLAADLVITEFMASNSGSLLDQDGNASDWIEIHNPSRQVVDLAGWSLTDSTAQLDRWRFPAFDLDPGGYLVVFASGKDRAIGGEPFHTNFKLSASGEYLALVSPDGSVVSAYGSDGTDFPPQFPNVSYGVPRTSIRLLAADTSFTYHVPTAADAGIGNGWTGFDFDASSWKVTNQVGLSQGVGFSPTIAHPFKPLVTTDVERSMLRQRSSIWLRQQFDITDPADLAGLTLQMQYDDGFVAYLNGVKVAEANAPENPVWNSTATATRLQDTTIQEFFLGTSASQLRSGRNVLAIQGLNASVDDLDLLIRPQLVAALPTDFATAPVGFLQRSTPNGPNSLLRTATVAFDHSSGLIDGPVTLRLTVDMPGATIHFSTDGSVPTEASPIYNDSAPLVIDTTTRVQAIAIAPDRAVSTPTSAWFTMVDRDLQGFSSNLPVVTLENFDAARPLQARFQFNALAIYEPDAVTGRTTLTQAPTLVTRAGIKVRGSSSAGRDKASFAVEAWDQRNEDKEIAPLGMPSASDWILYAPFNFDRALMRNALVYDLSNQVGRYAVRTRFVELYQNTDGGDLSVDDYRGVYVLMEKITVGPDRVDITPLQPGDDSEPDVSGGWLLKIDRADPGDTGFHAAGQTILYVDPKERNVTPPQADWIRNYFDQLEASLTDTDPETGYARYIDVDSWIDHHILNVLPDNVDAFRLSGYFFKDRGGKLQMGPVWDFDRSMESTDGRDDRPDVWGDTAGVSFFEYGWWGKLFQDPAFKQRWIDRWFELRQTVLSEQNVTATIDRMAAQLQEAQERNFIRWRSGSAPRTTANYPSGKLDGTWHGEVEHMKSWLLERLAWIDSQFPDRPEGTPASGLYPIGQPLRLSVDDGTVYFTTDGSDPLLPDGQAAPQAAIFNPTATVVTGDSAARFLVPTGAPAEAGWQTVGFDDAVWNVGTAGIGFDTGVSDARIDVPGGFTVRAVHAARRVGDFSTAESILSGTDVDHETTVPAVASINFLDEGPDGHFASNRAFPGGGGDDFVIDATATLRVNVEGTYTFGVNTDEGSKLWIDGQPVIQDVGTHPPRDRLERTTLTAGTHELRFVMFERRGGAEAELFVAAGDFRAFNEAFVLLGDEDLSFAPAIGTDVQSQLSGVNSSLYMRIPFVVEHASDTQHVTLGMRYDDGFVAYLNGVEVARRNAPATLAFDAAATDRRLDRSALTEKTIDITEFKGLLNDGQNLLAIAGLNVSPNNADFLVVPRLQIQRFGDPLLLGDSVALTARTSDAGQWSSPVAFSYVVAGSESDLSGVALTEIHFDPAEPTDAERASNPGLRGQDFEFIELANTGDHAVDLAGSRLTDGVTFTFPDDPRSRLEPGQFVLVVRNAAAFEVRYGSELPVVGRFTGRLKNLGERIALVDRFGTTLHDVRYGVGGAWPDRTAGVGSSLERVDPTRDANDPTAWRASAAFNGSPGELGRGPEYDILINEVLARSGENTFDRIELVNTTPRSIDVSGWWLSTDPQRFDAHAVPAGTTIAAGGYVTLRSDQTGLQFNGRRGGQLWLVEPSLLGRPTRFVDMARFGGSSKGVSLGRWPDADPHAPLFPMTEQTFGATNSGPVVGDVLVSEVHYHPAAPPDVVERFDDATTGGLTPRQGTWTVDGGRLHVEPDAAGDTVALLAAGAARTGDVRISTTLRIPATSAFNRNGAIVFDYQGPTDFKFASVHPGSGRWRIGQRNADGWNFLAQTRQTIPSGTDLAVSVELRGSLAVLRMGDSVKVSYDFGAPLTGGLIGLGSKKGEATFDDLRVTILSDPDVFEFVELLNRVDFAVDLAGWQLDGGIDMTLPADTVLGPGDAVVVVPFDPSAPAAESRVAQFRQVMGADQAVRLVGPFAGRLGNDGDTVELLRPLDGADPSSGVTVVDRLTYDDQAPWPRTADGGGHSLHRRNAGAFGGMASSFRPLNPSPGNEPFVMAGDMNLNGHVDADDVDGFVLALTDADAYARTFGVSNLLAGDLDFDGNVDYDDIGLLANRLGATTAGAVAEQTTDAVMRSWR